MIGCSVVQETRNVARERMRSSSHASPRGSLVERCNEVCMKLATNLCCRVRAPIPRSRSYIDFTADPNDFSTSGRIPDSFRDSWIVTTCKFGSSVVTATMLALLLARMFYLHLLQVMQNFQPNVSSPCPCLFPCSGAKDQPRCALLADGGWRNMLSCRYCFGTNIALRTFFEMSVCSLHVPPFVDFAIDMRLPVWKDADVHYDMHVNILSLFAVVRLYVLLRVLRNRVGFRSPGAVYIGKVNGVKADSVSFALKLLLKKAPWWVTATECMARCNSCAARATGSASQPASRSRQLTAAPLRRTYVHARRATIVLGTVSTVTTTAYLIWFVEKYSPLGFETFEQALWCTIVTMSTVGYGDVYPVSLPGRIIMTLGGIFGGTLTAGLITTVFVDLAILTENERRVLHVLDNQAVRCSAS